MEPLDPELRQLIDDGLTAAAPERGAESRGLESLLAHIDTPPLTPTVPAAPILGKLALVIATVVVTGGTWIANRPASVPVVGADTPAAIERQDPPKAKPSAHPPTPSTPVPPQQPTNPVTPAAEKAPRPRPEPHRPAPATRKADPPAPSTTADALRAEADLIARAESALNRDKPKEALALCDFHRTGFDAPQLTTERKAIAASAACMVKQTDTELATAFVRAHPRSALATKVRQRCGLVSDDETSQGQ